MRGVKRCQESTGRMKKHRSSDEFKVTAVKMVNAPKRGRKRGRWFKRNLWTAGQTRGG